MFADKKSKTASDICYVWCLIHKVPGLCTTVKPINGQQCLSQIKTGGGSPQISVATYGLIPTFNTLACSCIYSRESAVCVGLYLMLQYLPAKT